MIIPLLLLWKSHNVVQAEEQNTEKQAAQDVEAAMSTEQHATKLEQSSAI